ncbi:glycogen synthase GlgA [Magnetococcales bacterium HHB-1]
MKILFAASEAHPLSKTGGLADVTGAIPSALRNHKIDARLIHPGYPEALDRLDSPGNPISLGDPFGVGETRLVPGLLPDSNVPTWLVDCPALFRRAGSLYADHEGNDWPDNALRYALFCWAAVWLTETGPALGWQPDLIHAHDWQTGLIPTYLHWRQNHNHPVIFTVHNIGYAGLCPANQLKQLRLPKEAYSIEGVEFYNQISFLKAGIYYSHTITTVSPTYAEEIQTSDFGHGLHGLLNSRQERLFGILNGANYQQWNPETDPHIVKNYSVDNYIQGKAGNKAELQRRFNLPDNPNTPLLAVVSRLADQKGIDLLLPIINELVNLDCQLVILGTGDEALQVSLQHYAKLHPKHIAVFIQFDEGLAHQMQAGADFFLMPSRYEPCGLTQMYALRYGTLPVVRKTGGLADTITPFDQEGGNGFLFAHANPYEFLASILLALEIYRHHPDAWNSLREQAMRQNFSWNSAAKKYQQVYQDILIDTAP